MNELIISTRPKPYAFVLMPFSPDFEDLYELGIKATAEACGYYCERVDEQNFDGPIIARIYNQISKADVVIAVIDSSNANVFYELGYAHGIGQRTVLLSKNIKTVPFDIHQFPILTYTSIRHLRTGLTTKLKFYKEHLRDPMQKAINLELFYQGTQLLPQDNHSAVLSWIATRSRLPYLNLSLEIRNSTDVVYRSGYAIGVETEHLQSCSISKATNGTIKTISTLGRNKLHLFRSQEAITLWPQVWESAELRLTEPTGPARQANFSSTLKLYLYTDVGTNSFDFHFTIPSSSTLRTESNRSTYAPNPQIETPK